jgi:hypothetical protein
MVLMVQMELMALMVPRDQKVIREIQVQPDLRAWMVPMGLSDHKDLQA